MIRRYARVRLSRALAAAALIGLLCGNAIASPQLTPHRAEYKIKISVLGGILETNLRKSGQGYEADSYIKATGMARLVAHGNISEKSWFDDTSGSIRPARFVSSDTLSKGGEEVDITFDWDKQEIKGQIDGEDFHTSIEGLLQDRVSLQYALMHDLLNDNFYATYSLQDAEKLKLLSVTNLGTKTVKVPYGSVEAIGLQHRADTSSRVTTMWFAEELGYLPVLIEQHRKGKLQVRAMLREYVPEVESVVDAE